MNVLNLLRDARSSQHEIALYDQSMHPEGLVMEARSRLGTAGLIPPISGLEAFVINGTEAVLLTVRGPLDPDLTAAVAEALDGVPYELREVSAEYGILYGKPGNHR